MLVGSYIGEEHSASASNLSDAASSWSRRKEKQPVATYLINSRPPKMTAR